MNRNYSNIVESMVKLLLQRNDAIGPYVDLISKAQSLSKAGQICSYRAYNEYLIRMLSCHMFPNPSNEDRCQIIHHCIHEMEECDKAMNEVCQDVWRDELIKEAMKR